MVYDIYVVLPEHPLRIGQGKICYVYMIYHICDIIGEMTVAQLCIALHELKGQV